MLGPLGDTLRDPPSVAPRARRSAASRQKRCAPVRRFPPPLTGIRTGRFPMGGLRWVCPRLMVDAIFFAELSQAGCRTRGVDGRLVHRAPGRIQQRQFLLTRLDRAGLLVNSVPRATKHRIAALCNRSLGCSLPRPQPPASASRSKAANTKGNPAAASKRPPRAQTNKRP